MGSEVHAQMFLGGVEQDGLAHARRDIVPAQRQLDGGFRLAAARVQRSRRWSPK